MNSSDEDATIFIWNTGATTANINVTGEGNYWVRASNNCHVTNDTFRIRYSNIYINLGNDTTICASSHIILNAYDSTISTYHWNNGSSNSTMDVSQPGIYYVTGNDKDCSTSDTITVDVADPYVRILENDTTICSNQPLKLHAEANPMSSFSWNNGATDNTTIASKAATYIVTAKNQCGSYSDSVVTTVENCDCYLFVPSAFSPNGDGFNDVFKPNLACNPVSYTMDIFNRYGQRIFMAASPAVAWDGTFHGRLIDEGTYFYYIKFKGPLGNIVERKGDITLIR